MNLRREPSIASEKLEVQKNIDMTLRCCIRMNLRREPSLRAQRSNLNLLFNQLKDDKDCFLLRSSQFSNDGSRFDSKRVKVHFINS